MSRPIILDLFAGPGGWDGCGVILAPGRITCPEHGGLKPPAPDCPDGHGALAFVIVSGVELGGLLHLMYACPSCDYVTVVDYPPTTVAPGVAERARCRPRTLAEAPEGPVDTPPTFANPSQ